MNMQRPLQLRRSVANEKNNAPPTEMEMGATFKSPPQSGQKRRFGAAGIINVLLTNLVLQALLASNVVSVAAGTLISQAINACLGYAIYGKMVFKAKGLRNHRPLLRYLLLMVGMWLLNSVSIGAGEALGINRNIAAAAMIPILAVLSFISQKYWVFK